MQTVPAVALRIAPLLLALGLCGAPRAHAEDEPKPESRMWKRLKSMDTDGDGTISRKEFQGPDRFWDRLDGDGDGVVSRAEADKVGAGRGGGQGRGGRAGPGGMGARRGPPRARGLSLEALDTNEDGAVSKAEWSAFFTKADENEDKLLQKEEWDAAVGGGAIHDPAPKLGAAAPKVSAQVRGLKAKIDLAKPKRVTVLIFGSWT